MAPNHGRPGTDALFDTTSELGRDLASVDWAGTPLGPVETWPNSLRTSVRLMLGSRFAMWMAWGPELTFFCNDAYRRDTLAAKYPWALGRRSDEVWSEIWPDIGPRIDSVLSTGLATWDEALLLFLERSGYQEETYHTFSYSPIADDDGTIAGMLCVVSEDTARVVGERRMATVRDLATALARASTSPEVSSAAGRQLAEDANNLPFAAGYLFNADASAAELAWTAGIAAGHPVAPRQLLRSDRRAIWPLRELAMGRAPVIDLTSQRFAGLPTGAWPEPPVGALAVPFAQPGERRPLGFMVVGLNRYRPLDESYRGFIDLIASQVAAGVVRARAFDEERRRAEELAELDRAKTTFFTNVSHELRTPLTLLLGPAQDALTDDSAPLPAAQRHRLEVIQRNGERLLKLVNTLLDFSRMEAGSTVARFEPLDLARYTAELGGMFDAAMHRAELDFNVVAEPLSGQVYVDAEMWAKIVLNLISNALKATFTGSIEVRLRDVDSAAQLDVVDTGVGIPQPEQQRLFERFHRVSGAALRSHEGSGIGLALVAELAAAHGGTVGVQSEPGRGTTFSVRIPYGHDHLPADQVVLETPGELPAARSYSAGYLAETTRWLDAADAELPNAGSADGRPSVLVVDDNADMRDYVIGLLSGSYDVRSAPDGLAALELARNNPPDLVLTDVMMPLLDGFGLLSALRADQATLHIPVVMLSARSGDDATVEGLEAGADDYLVKPFSARELLARVRANLELDRVRRVADELARSRALLDQAESLAHVGSWEIDLRAATITGSTEFFAILGRPADGSEVSVQDVLDRVWPADLPDVITALESLRAGAEPIDIELRVRSGEAEDADRLVRVHGVARPDADGGVAFARGSVQDITEQRRAEQAVTAAAVAQEAAAREHAIAEQLQRSLLPDALFDAGALELATFYRAGVEGTQAGGDWYDVIELGNGRTALVLGDVMGRGVRAAAVMGQLRATVRAYARLDLSPAQLLALLDRAVRELSEHMIVTCVYAVHDPAAGTITYSNAGHLPPLLLLPGMAARQLTAGCPPLGSGHPASANTVVAFPEGALLALYTDGLVEHRGSHLDDGIHRLADELGRLSIPLEALPGALADALLPAEPDDDVAILLAQQSAPQVRRWRTAISATAQPPGAAVSAARRAAAAVLADWGIHPDVSWDLLLAASELATNAVRHGIAPMELRLRLLPTGVVLEVHDGSSAPPRPRIAPPEAPSGRGLYLVASVATAWGVRPTGNGKAVWSLFPLVPADLGDLSPAR